ncbi:MAG: long-chain-fatty-acid--CoA ligase [Desulfobacterales bacterium]|nr:long-chain-fatty-acid--CoA ligase [Desulfobacterales bacterium]
MATLPDMLRSISHQHHDKIAFWEAENHYSYGQFLERVQSAAGILANMGLGPGDRFAIVAPNRFETAILIYAGYWSGTVPVPLNFRLAPPEICFMLDDCNAKCLFIDDSFAALLNDEKLKTWKDTTIFIGSDKEGRSYETMLANADKAPEFHSNPDDDAIILYTGGTTGRSKGVRLSHRNIISDALQCAPILGPRRDDIYLHAAPMFHSADLLGTVWILFGAGHVYMPTFSPVGLLEIIERCNITFTMLPPTMIIMALQVSDFHNYELSSLRGLIYGASPMAVEWIKKTIDAFPSVELYQGYGLTETSPLLTILSWQTHHEALEKNNHERLKSCGHPIPGVELRIVNDNDQEVLPGNAGEVVARGPNVMEGYLNLENDTAEVLRNGWFHTGDVGQIDTDGLLYLLDRKKDMVISGGENIYTSEVEATLYKHPSVQEVAVIGIPDEKFGEALMAVIVALPDASITEDDIIQHCRGKIGGYKIPRHIQFVDAIPKSALGKILKTELRKEFSDKA